MHRKHQLTSHHVYKYLVLPYEGPWQAVIKLFQYFQLTDTKLEKFTYELFFTYIEQVLNGLVQVQTVE
jgi:hypothetical protein